VWAYLLRRVLWMIPTFVGILVINFAVIRLQAPSLSDQLSQPSSGGGEGMGGERNADERVANIEQYIGKFRRAGNHLPAVINLRGFTDKDDVLAELRRIERGANELRPSQRLRVETDLWMSGHFYVAPLVDILADDALAEYHGPASEALRLCAYVPPDEVSRAVTRGDASDVAVEQVRATNDLLKKSVIAYRNTEEAGFESSDSAAADKRAAMLAWFGTNEAEYRTSWGRALGATLTETGFVDLMGKLFTGRLYSYSKQQYVFTMIGDRWYVTLWLNIISISIAWGISIPLGIHSARRLGSLEDKVTTNMLFFLWSIPSFFVGTLLLHHLCTDSSTGVQWFPNAGLASKDSIWYSAPRLLLDLIWHGALPLLVLTYASFTALSRYMRGNMLDQLHADYVRTARAKGASDDRVVYGHALRNSMVTMITLGSGLIADLYGGFLFVEIIFSIQGLGLLVYEAALDADAPLLMGSTVISVGLLLVSILVADIMYAVVDPRIRSRYA
jgi:ABC-type dipeptide/oligopeptide/nickel transport system permease component